MADTTQHMPTPAGRAHHRRPGGVAVLAAAALLLGACSTGAPSAEPAAVPVDDGIEFASAADAVDWNDDHTHLEVVTVNAPDGTVEPEDPADSGAEPEPPSTNDTAEPTDATITVVTPSGSQVLDRPPSGLLPVEPQNAAELAALDAAEPASFIAVDVEGEIGPPGARYIRSLTTITAITGGAVGQTPPEAPSPGTPSSGGELFAEIDEQETAPPVDGDVSDAIEVQVDGDVSDEAIAAAIAEMEGVVEVDVVGPGIIAVAVEDHLDRPVGEAISELDGVDAVNEDLLAYVSSDPLQPDQWAIANTGSPNQAAGSPGVPGADIAAPDAWSVTTGTGVTVAVIDTGQDLAHRDLAENTWSNPGEICGNGIDDDANGFRDDCSGWDFGSNDNTPSVPPSTNGFHGTHVAGVVAAAANGVGVVGGAPGATLMPLKVARDDGLMPMSAVAAAINYASDNGADVINLSLGTRPGTFLGYNSSTELAIRNARAKGVVVVVAAGNDSTNLDSTGPGWPAGFAATYDNVITVGASTNSDTHAYFSNTGSIVTIHAPGWAILSTMPGSTDGIKYGTSMAAPYVAAAAAAVIASGQATGPSAVISHLETTAADVGWGTRLDLAEAVGYEAPLGERDLDVTLAGARDLVADTPGTLDWTIEAAEATSATGVRLSVAARHAGGIGAVDGLEVTFADAAGELATHTSNAEGAFPVLAIRDVAALVDGGLNLRATTSMPASDYAFVVELVDATGAEVSASYASYVTVADPAAPPTTNAPGGDGGTPTTQPPATQPPATQPPGTAPPATQPGDGGGGGGTPTAPPTTTAPGGEPPSGGGDPGTPTTTPVTTQPGGSTPSTTTPSTTPATTTPGAPPPPGDDGQPPSATTTVPGPSDPDPSQPPTTTDPGTPVTTQPGGSTPSTTAPGTPDPAQDGAYRALAVSPPGGPIDGLTRVTVSGSFPAEVPVYVWFGDQPTASVRGVHTADGIMVDSPIVDEPGIRDVIVKFETDRAYELRLVDAYTYTPSSTPTVPPTTSPGSGPATTTPDGGGGGGSSGGGGGTPATTVPGTPPPAVTTTTTTTTTVPGSPPGSSPTPPPGDSPTTTSPGSAPPPPAPPTTSAPETQRELGDLVLRPLPTSGALSRLTTGSWPAQGCSTEICSASRL